MHQAADGKMCHQQTEELLPDQFRRLTAQYNLSTTQMRFQLVQRGLDFPPFVSNYPLRPRKRLQTLRIEFAKRLRIVK